MTQKITGHTGLTCLLGSPVSHSISPAMHNASFSHLNLDYAYMAFDVNEETLPSVVSTLKTINARGWNLTMPNKNAMCALCDKLSTAAHISGSVNTVVNDNGILTGHTTDGVGFLRAAEDAGYPLPGKKITLLGAGGASTAIMVQAALDGIKEISIFSRRSGSYAHASQIVKRLNQETSCRVRLFDYEDMNLLKQEIHDSYMLINGTNIGMAPNMEACIIPDSSYFHSELIVSDIIYNPRETKLLRLAQDAGLKTFNGLYMLLYQGAEAFYLWTGKKMPISMIKEDFFK